jgi:hypothetical protein
VYLPPCTPRLRVCQCVPPAPYPPIKGLQIPKSFPPIPPKSGRSSSCLTSPRLVPGLTDPNLTSCSKMPMSTSSPNCPCQPPCQTANVNPFAKMHHPRAPHSCSVSLPIRYIYIYCLKPHLVSNIFLNKFCGTVFEVSNVPPIL